VCRRFRCGPTRHGGTGFHYSSVTRHYRAPVEAVIRWRKVFRKFWHISTTGREAPGKLQERPEPPRHMEMICFQARFVVVILSIWRFVWMRLVELDRDHRKRKGTSESQARRRLVSGDRGFGSLRRRAQFFTGCTGV